MTDGEDRPEEEGAGCGQLCSLLRFGSGGSREIKRRRRRQLKLWREENKIERVASRRGKFGSAVEARRMPIHE